MNTDGGRRAASSETVLLDIDRCAALRGLDVPHEPVEPRGRVPRVRFVPAMGVDALLERCGASGSTLTVDVEQWALPAQLVVTDQRVRAIARDAELWSCLLGDIVEVVHSATEPCTVIRERDGREHAVLVTTAEADSLRTAIDDALELDPVPQVSEPETEEVPVTGPQPQPRVITATPGLGDRVFRAGSRLAGFSVLAIMALVGLFLLVLSLPALKATGLSFLTTAEWQPDIHHFGIAAVLTGTILIALVALAVAVPLAIGTALFISEVVPRPLRQTAIAMVDLMAAVPSVVYGMWGKVILQDHVIGVSRWLATWFSWIPIFKVDRADPRNPLGSATVFTASTFIAGLVVALMVIPIACSIMREVFSQAPAGEREGAYALGSTRWGMIRSVVLPFGKGGMIGATMLGLGRALGETVAVYLIISPVFTVNFHVLQSGSNSVSSLIALRQGDASGFGRSALMAAGLALFVITLVVNFTASSIVAKARSGAQSEA
jgi:phosphate transport system permease protein